MSTQSKFASFGTDQFQTYLSQFKDNAKSEGVKNYYHVNVVADAYSKGFNDGEESGKKDFINDIIKSNIEEFTSKANQAYILTNRIVSFIKENGNKVNSFYINIFHESPKVIIVVDNNLLINDEFIEATYSKIFELKKIFNVLFKKTVLDMGLMSSDGLDQCLLVNDGFEYFEDFVKNE